MVAGGASPKPVPLPQRIDSFYRQSEYYSLNGIWCLTKVFHDLSIWQARHTIRRLS